MRSLNSILGIRVQQNFEPKATQMWTSILVSQALGATDTYSCRTPAWPCLPYRIKCIQECDQDSARHGKSHFLREINKASHRSSTGFDAWSFLTHVYIDLLCGVCEQRLRKKQFHDQVQCEIFFSLLFAGKHVERYALHFQMERSRAESFQLSRSLTLLKRLLFLRLCKICLLNLLTQLESNKVSLLTTRYKVF